MTDLHVVILAAGKGTRMKSSVPKVLHPLAGRTLVDHVLRTTDSLGAASTVLVVGYGAEAVRAHLSSRGDLQFAVQSPQLGTAHALLQTEPLLARARGTVLLIYADVPLLQAATLHRLVEHHRTTQAAATVLTTKLEDPYGYGRIVRDASGRIARIAEERDAFGDERAIQEINSGIYALELLPLFDALHKIAAENAQGEYYLTDLVALYRKSDRIVETLRLDDASELRGVNSRADLADLSEVLRSRKRKAVMLDGVTLEQPSSTHIDEDVTIGPDTVIGPGVILGGSTAIGSRCRIHAGTRITNSKLGDDVTVLDHSVVTDSVVASNVSLGPFAHLRPHSDIAEGARIGNFVEVKNTKMGRGSKANHLSYLGDATIGEGVNIGAGTITCNYDGERKHQTVIEDGVFVGSDSQLIAPVTLAKGAYVDTGATIRENVPPGALAVSAGKQRNIEGWVAEKKKRQALQKKD